MTTWPGQAPPAARGHSHAKSEAPQPATSKAKSSRKPHAKSRPMNSPRHAEAQTRQILPPYLREASLSVIQRRSRRRGVRTNHEAVAMKNLPDNNVHAPDQREGDVCDDPVKRERHRNHCSLTSVALKSLLWRGTKSLEVEAVYANRTQRGMSATRKLRKVDF